LESQIHYPSCIHLAYFPNHYIPFLPPQVTIDQLH
jgi:hypothetical protein